MKPELQTVVLGVDAGGTKTVAAAGLLEDAAGTIQRGTGIAGAANPRSVGFESAWREIRLAVSRAFEDADLDECRAAVLCLSAAGAGREEEQQRLRQLVIDDGLADRVLICTDAEPILAAASPDATGIALISGTGSFAWGRSADGTTARAGGWGYLLGDEGSGYAVAVAALRAAVRAADGRGARTELLDYFQERLKASVPSDLISIIYGPDMTRRDIAMLAAGVFSLADCDQAAQEIVDQAGTQLAELVTVLAGRLRFSGSSLTLGITGGLLLNQPEFRMQVIQKAGVLPERAVDVPVPAYGSLVMAARSAAVHCGTTSALRDDGWK